APPIVPTAAPTAAPCGVPLVTPPITPPAMAPAAAPRCVLLQADRPMAIARTAIIISMVFMTVSEFIVADHPIATPPDPFRVHLVARVRQLPFGNGFPRQALWAKAAARECMIMTNVDTAAPMAGASTADSLSWTQEVRASFRLAWPLIVAQLAQNLLFTTDV